jgi:hypothetical protein
VRLGNRVPQHIFCKDIASEWKESWLSISRVQHIFCKDTPIF